MNITHTKYIFPVSEKYEEYDDDDEKKMAAKFKMAATINGIGAIKSNKKAKKTKKTNENNSHKVYISCFRTI